MGKCHVISPVFWLCWAEKILKSRNKEAEVTKNNTSLIFARKQIHLALNHGIFTASTVDCYGEIYIDETPFYFTKCFIGPDITLMSPLLKKNLKRILFGAFNFCLS